MLRPARPLNARLRPGRVYFGLGTAQKAGANLHSGRSEQESGSYTTWVSDPARCNHWQTHRISHRGHEREEAYLLHFRQAGIKTSPVTSRLHALHYDRVRACSLCGFRFSYG
jgi:hypothetical protein